MITGVSDHSRTQQMSKYVSVSKPNSRTKRIFQDFPGAGKFRKKIPGLSRLG